jgi:hypothetical protein
MMNFKEGQKVRILKKSVGVSYKNSRVCDSCRKNGFVTYSEKFVDNYYGTGHFHTLIDDCGYTADFIDGDFILLLPTFIEVDE